MKRSKPLSPLSRTLAFAAPAVVLSTPAASAADMYLKIDNLTGESNAKGHEQWIDVTSVSYGFTSPANPLAGGGSAGKTTAQEFVIEKAVDSSSPPLFMSCLSGTRLNEVKLEVVTKATNPAIYYRVTLSDVMVTKIAAESGVAGERPTEKISLSYVKFKLDYMVVNDKNQPGSPITTTWNFATNTK